jgi:hypothetical protein
MLTVCRPHDRPTACYPAGDKGDDSDAIRQTAEGKRGLPAATYALLEFTIRTKNTIQIDSLFCLPCISLVE